MLSELVNLTEDHLWKSLSQFEQSFASVQDTTLHYQILRKFFKQTLKNTEHQQYLQKYLIIKNL